MSAAPSVRIYTTSSCSYCVAAKRLLTQKNIPFQEIDVSRDQATRQKLSEENNGYRAVPMIFIGEEFIGGFSDLAALDQSGNLQKKVASA
jgi:glutaredoxin 3